MKLKPPADSSDLEEARAIAARLSAGLFGPTKNPAPEPEPYREARFARAVEPAFEPPPPPPPPAPPRRSLPPVPPEPHRAPPPPPPRSEPPPPVETVDPSSFLNEPEPEREPEPEPEPEPMPPPPVAPEPEVEMPPPEPEPEPEPEPMMPEPRAPAPMDGEDSSPPLAAIKEPSRPQFARWVPPEPPVSRFGMEDVQSPEPDVNVPTEEDVAVAGLGAEPEPGVSVGRARFEPSEPQFANFVPEFEENGESEVAIPAPEPEPEPEPEPPPPLVEAAAPEPSAVDALMEGLIGGAPDPADLTDPLGALADIGPPAEPEPEPVPTWSEILDRCQTMVGARAAMLVGPDGKVIESTDGWPPAGVSAVAGKLLPLLDKKEKEGAAGGISVRLGDRILTTWRVALEGGARLTMALLADQPVSLELRAEIEEEIRRGRLE